MVLSCTTVVTCVKPYEKVGDKPRDYVILSAQEGKHSEAENM